VGVHKSVKKGCDLSSKCGAADGRAVHETLGMVRIRECRMYGGGGGENKSLWVVFLVPVWGVWWT